MLGFCSEARQHVAPSSTDRLFSIRPRAPSDAAFIRALGTRAFGEYSTTAGNDAVSMANRSATLVAHRGEELLGFVIVEPKGGDAAHLSAIAVTEDARGEGIGRALLRAAGRLARARGATLLELTTADSNVAALELFLRSGFKRVRTTPKQYPRGQRMVDLERPL